MPQRVIDGVAELRGLVGQEVGVSDWFMVTQERINAFAEVAEDRQWIHCDADRARAESPYGTTVAHGYLTLSLLGHLLSQAVRVGGSFSRKINYGLNRVRFPAAVPAGAGIRARCTLQAAEEVPGGLQIAWVVTMECEGQSRPVMVAESLSRFSSDTAEALVQRKSPDFRNGVEGGGLNVNGGSIAIGHPFGMTGSRLVGTLANEMIRRKARYGVVTMSVGGGQGAAGLFELCD